MKDKKSRFWVLIGYPESLPIDWKERLTQSGVQVAISPLHDKDLNETTGELKKPHYHMILNFGGPTTYAVALGYAEMLNAPNPQPNNSVIGAIRYFTHRDNPEKAQYSKKDITTINGFDIGAYDAPTASEKVEIKKQISILIRKESIHDYGLLMTRLENENDLWWQVASESTIFFRALTDTQYRRKKHDVLYTQETE